MINTQSWLWLCESSRNDWRQKKNIYTACHRDMEHFSTQNLYTATSLITMLPKGTENNSYATATSTVSMLQPRLPLLVLCTGWQDGQIRAWTTVIGLDGLDGNTWKHTTAFYLIKAKHCPKATEITHIKSIFGWNSNTELSTHCSTHPGVSSTQSIVTNSNTPQ